MVFRGFGEDVGWFLEMLRMDLEGSRVGSRVVFGGFDSASRVL